MTTESQKEHRRAYMAKYSKDYYARNQERLLAIAREWKLKHPGYMSAFNKRPDQKLKNKERCRRRYRRVFSNKANRDLENERLRLYHRNNPEKHYESTKRWNKRNPHRVKTSEQKYRALKASAATDTESVRQFFSWIKNQDFVTCTYCGVFISGKSVHIDHIVPLSRGGSHLPDNFALACGSCNSSKHDLLLSEWRRCPEKFKTN